MQTSVHQHNHRYLWQESEPQYSGEPKHYMNMSCNNNNQESEMQLREYQQYTEREPEQSLSIRWKRFKLDSERDILPDAVLKIYWHFCCLRLKLLFAAKANFESAKTQGWVSHGVAAYSVRPLIRRFYQFRSFERKKYNIRNTFGW